MKYLVLLTALLLAACADQLYPDLPAYMQAKNIRAVTMQDFPHCQNYGCATVKNVRLSHSDWQKIQNAFGAPAANAAEERQRIARTIGTFEQIVGPITNTQDDREGTFLETGDGQLDCVDESSNTMIYMMLLEDAGLVRFHTIEQPQVRYPILSGRGWMHQTAVLTETETGQQYAIDSWFEDNGRAAYIVPLTEWRNGWHPRPR